MSGPVHTGNVHGDGNDGSVDVETDREIGIKLNKNRPRRDRVQILPIVGPSQGFSEIDHLEAPSVARCQALAIEVT